MENARDRAAKAVLSGFSAQQELSEVKNIINKYDFGRGRQILAEEITAQLKANPLYCPKCGELSMRRINGKYGEFLGCRNYPSCRYTKNER